MKSIIFIFIFTIFFVNIYSAELKLAISSSTNEDNSAINLSKNIIQELSKRTGINIKYEVLPGARGLEMAESGDIDGAFARTKEATTGYNNLIIVPESILKVEVIAFSKGKKDIQPTWELLKDYKVIAILGDKIIKTKLYNKMKKGTFMEVSGTIESLLKMLLMERADFAVYYSTDLTDLIKKIDTEQELYQYTNPLDRIELYILLNKSKSEYIKPLTDAIIKMKKDGTMDKMVKKYLEVEKRKEQEEK